MNIRPDHHDERRAAAAFDGFVEGSADSRNLALRGITLVIVTLFWISQFAANMLYAQLTSPEDAVASIWPRALVCIAGELITLAGIAVQDRWRHSRMLIRAYWAIALTVISSAALGAIGYLIFEAAMGPLGTSPFWARFWTSYPVQIVPRLWVFGSVYAMALAISYSILVREREEEIGALRALAQDAQLRALRSQLSPHFLFNALNSIAALISEGRAKQAEETTEHLADFLRTTLSLDPQRMITIGEEAALQRIYLDIQKVRFPTRLNVVFNIAAKIENALVPNLILQPLVENSVKYAVARSTAPVSIEVRARADGGKLEVVVEDDGGNSDYFDAPVGNRMGLTNVAERLRAHFGGNATLTSGPRTEGGYRNTILIPFRGAA